MKTKNTQIILTFFLISLFFFTSFRIYAQEAETLKQKEKREIEHTKKVTLQLMKSNPSWISYKAFRQNDTSLCENTENSQGCWNRVNLYSFLKKMANADCSSLPNDFREYTDVCLAIQQNDCNGLVSYKKLLCAGLLNKSTSEIKRAWSDPSFNSYVERKNDKAEMFLNLYLGFKTSNENNCNRFTTRNLLLRASCNMLIGNQSYEKKLDSISQDIATTIVAKKYKDPGLCNDNSNSDIKDACLDNSVTPDDVNKIFWF